MPFNESDRLQELRDYGILDTESDETFNQITALAAEIFGVEFSVVSFVDEYRQWFKSRQGLSISETPRDISFCGHAILSDEVLVVPDALQDNRFFDNPLVANDPGIRFYAGAPLITPTGFRLGTLCVFSPESKTITESQKKILHSLSRHVVDMLELRKKTAQLSSYEKIFQQSVDPVMTLSPDGRLISANPATLRLFAVDSIERFLMLGPEDILPEFQPGGEASVIKLKLMITEALEKGSAYFEWTFKKYLGKNMLCTVLLSRIDHGSSTYFQATVRDISSIVETEDKHRMLLETMSEGLVIFGENGVSGFNSSALKILQLTDVEITLRSPLPKGWEAILEDGKRFPLREHPAFISLKTGSPIHAFKMGIRLPNSELRWIMINTVPVETPAGRIVISTFSDITSLVRSAEEHRFVLDVIGVGVWKVNLVTGEQVWDRQMYQLHGLDPQHFSNDYDSWKKLLTQESRDILDESLAKIFQGSDSFSSSLELLTPSGEKRALGSRGEVTRNKDGEPIMIYGINWDRTKEVELEKSLEIERVKSLHTAKLASIGQLAAGVGHEINNPLAIISGLIKITEQMIENGADSKTISDKFRKMDSSVLRIANIVKGLRTFALSDRNEVTEFDPFILVNETVNFIREVYHAEGISISVNEEKNNVVTMTANRGRIQQVLVNLLSNAKDASLGKEERKISLSVTSEKNEIEISVTDNGSGICPKIREKIFEPFFTTKDVNLGTGIGLSLVNTIVKEHDGKIELKSDLGVGTEFKIRLPVQLKSTSAVNLVNKPAMRKIDRRVLLVDDEADLGEVLKEILSYHFTEIITAESAAEALRILKEEKIDLVLSDIKMPVMDGFDFLKAIRKEPSVADVKFLFLTGGIEMTPAELKIVKTDSDGVFYKPVKIPDLLEKITSLFNES